MVVGVNLLEDKDKMEYWFNVPKNLEAGFRSGRLNYVLVDTAYGLKLARIIGYSPTPIGPEPTKSVVSFISTSAIEDFYGSRRKKELENEIVNKVANTFSLIAPKNNRFDISLEDKISMLDFISGARGNSEFRKRVEEIDRLSDELSELGLDWRDF